MLLPLNSGISLSLAGQDFWVLWVMGGNHFPCLLNKTIKRHYELASGKAFACHCLHLFEGVSGLSCCFWLLQNIIILLQSVWGVGGDAEETTHVRWSNLHEASSAFKLFFSRVYHQNVPVWLWRSAAALQGIICRFLSLLIKKHNCVNSTKAGKKWSKVTHEEKTSKLPSAYMHHIPWSGLSKAMSDLRL